MRAVTVVSSVRAPARASVKPFSRSRVRTRRFLSSSRASVVVSAVDAQSLSDGIGLDSAVEAGCIVFAARFGALGLGKAKQGSDIERALEMCETRGIDVRDLYYDEDQGEQRWYLGRELVGAGEGGSEVRRRTHVARVEESSAVSRWEEGGGRGWGKLRGHRGAHGVVSDGGDQTRWSCGDD